MIETVSNQEACPDYRLATVSLEGVIMENGGCYYYDNGICRCPKDWRTFNLFRITCIAEGES